MIATAPVRMVTNIVKAAWDQITGAASAGSGGGPAPQPGGGAPAANAALARKMMPSWATGIAWTDWNNVAVRESGWDNFAMNAGSGAYGIPQALPYTKMPKPAWPASAGGSSNPGDQISWMVGYVEDRYTNPQGAWAHEEAYGWYGNGGPTSAGWAMVGERGRELVKLPGGATVYPHGNTEGMVAGGGADVHITLELGPNFIQQTGLTPQQLADIRHEVNIRGGNVQTAFGRA
jgi:SLT domain-containing protein